MKVEIRANGRLELRITDPEGRTQEAALGTMIEAVLNGQKVEVKTIDDPPVMGLEISLDAL